MKTALRRTAVAVLIGFIAGSVLGGVLLHREGQRVRQLGQQEEGAFAVVCQGGDTPYVVISWPERMAPIIAGLERSEEGGAWMNISADATDSRFRYADAGVEPGKTYHYHVMWSGVEVVRPVSVTTDRVSCTPKP